MAFWTKERAALSVAALVLLVFLGVALRVSSPPSQEVAAVHPSDSRADRTDLAVGASPGGHEPASPRPRALQLPVAAEQRARAQKMREQLQEAATKWGTARDPRQSAAPATIPAVLDKEYTFSRIKEHFIPLADSCYRSLLEQRPAAAGKVHFFFSIVGDETIGGVVESVDLEDERTTMDEPDFLYCVRESMLSVQFDPPPKYGRATIGFDLEFAPGSDGPDGGT
jgi:hypothetical protein